MPSCAEEYGQCGGMQWAGSTCCVGVSPQSGASISCFRNNAYHSQCLAACPQGWECNGPVGLLSPVTSAGHAQPHGGGDGGSGHSLSSLSSLGGGVSLLAGKASEAASEAAQRFRTAAQQDSRIYGSVYFFGGVGCFLLLACVTFCRVRRRGGRVAPPKLDFASRLTRITARGTVEVERMIDPAGRSEEAGGRKMMLT